MIRDKLSTAEVRLPGIHGNLESTEKSESVEYLESIHQLTRRVFSCCEVYWCTHFRLRMARCDNCKLIEQDVECRPSDEILCGSCHQDNLIKGIRAMAGIKECIETRTTMQEGHEADDMTLGEQEGKDDNDDEQEGVNEPDDEFEEQTITDEDYIYNLVVKNDHDEESCWKCTRKIKNGVRCKSCKRAFHSGRCSGLTQEQIKNEAAKENVWICGMCKHPNKNCPCCRDKDKEIKNL